MRGRHGSDDDPMRSREGSSRNSAGPGGEPNARALPPDSPAPEAKLRLRRHRARRSSGHVLDDQHRVPANVEVAVTNLDDSKRATAERHLNEANAVLGGWALVPADRQPLASRITKAPLDLRQNRLDARPQLVRRSTALKPSAPSQLDHRHRWRSSPAQGSLHSGSSSYEPQSAFTFKVQLEALLVASTVQPLKESGVLVETTTSVVVPVLH
jgi:hypothetical protein